MCWANLDWSCRPWHSNMDPPTVMPLCITALSIHSWDVVNGYTLSQGGFSEVKDWLCLSVSHSQYNLIIFLIYWTGRAALR